MNRFLSAVIPYAIGVVTFLLWFGIDRAAGMGGEYNWPQGDLTQHIAGAYAYLDGAWQFPLFQTDRINAPEGANIIFTDSAPFAGLIAKLIYTVTGLRWNYIGTWFFVLWVGQSVAGAYLLKQLQVRHWALIACGSILALSFPAFLFRHGHLALSSHFLILLSLGLYFRGTRGVSYVPLAIRWFVLLSIALFTHAYLFVMCFVIFFSGILEDVTFKRTEMRVALRWGCLIMTSMLLLGWAGGYFTPKSMGQTAGYDYYSMNLLSPFWPVMSAFWPATTTLPSGQYEGINYLGLAGLLSISLAVFVFRMDLLKQVRRHPILCVSLLGMCAYAVSTTVWFGPLKIISLSPPNFPPFSVFRASGRFFWPLGYVLLFISFAALTSYFQNKVRFVIPIAMALTLTQAVEGSNLLKSIINPTTSPGMPSVALSISQASFVRVFPKWECIQQGTKESSIVSQIIWLAAKSAVPIDDAHLAHADGSDCNILPPQPGSLSVYLPSAMPILNSDCWQADGLVLCGVSPETRKMLAWRGQRMTMALPLCQSVVNFSSQKLPLLVSGVASREDWGRWTEGAQARLQCVFSGTEPTHTLALTGRGYAPEGREQTVTIGVNEQSPVTMNFGPNAKTVEFDIKLKNAEILDITIRVAQPVSPKSQGVNGDTRKLGLGLLQLQLK